MKIVHTEASLGWGGQEIRTFREALALRDKGHDVFFIIQKGAKLAKAAKENNFKVLEVNFFKKYWLLSLPKIIVFLKLNKISLVVTHSSLDAWLGALAARLSSISVIRIRHVSTPTRAGLNAKLLFKKLADFVITTSTEIIKPLSLASGQTLDRIKCIPTGIDISKLSVSDQEIVDFKRSLGIEPDDFIFGSVCVVRSWKGIDTLIDAAYLLKDVPHVKCLIVGGGYLEHHIQRVKDLKLDQIVLFTGHLDDPKIAMASLDVFLLLSTSNEGISQATLQASYLKKPLITTPTGGLKEVCIHEQTGIIVPLKDPNAVRDAIVALKDVELRKKYGQAAHEHVIQSFLFEKTFKEDRKHLFEVHMLSAVKDKLRKFPAGFYVMVVGFLGILTVISLRQGQERKRQEAFLSLFGEYEKKASPELLEQLLYKTQNSSTLKKRFGARLLQEVVLFRPDILTKEWIKEPIKVKDNYDRFSEGSLLIAENKLEDALIQGESLQKDLTVENSPALYAFNVFRMAVLHDKLGHIKEAKNLFESIMTQNKVRETLNNAYKFEAVSVSEYISDRLSTLSDD